MSGVGTIGKTSNDPSLVVGVKATDERESQWGPIDGEIVDYNAAAGTATVKPLYKPIHNGQVIDMPNLLEVPINFPRSGSGAITHPIPAGTRVRLTPQMRSSENYHNADDGTPSDKRSFALADMEASLAGGNSLSDPLPNVDPDSTHIRADPAGNYGLKLHESGKFSLIGSEGNVYTQIFEGFDQCQQMAALLATEPALVHNVDYAAIAVALQNIVTKLNAMAL